MYIYINCSLQILSQFVFRYLHLQFRGLVTTSYRVSQIVYLQGVSSTIHWKISNKMLLLVSEKLYKSSFTYLFKLETGLIGFDLVVHPFKCMFCLSSLYAHLWLTLHFSRLLFCETTNFLSGKKSLQQILAAFIVWPPTHLLSCSY